MASKNKAQLYTTIYHSLKQKYLQPNEANRVGSSFA